MTSYDDDNDDDNCSCQDHIYEKAIKTCFFSYNKKDMEENKKARNFRQYPVWQMAVDYATKVYKTTAEMPWFEKKGLCDQLQRATVSISSNIAEGCAKPSDIEFAKFLDTALGSSYEVETQLTIAHNVDYINDELFNDLMNDVQSIERQLTGFILSIFKE